MAEEQKPAVLIGKFDGIDDLRKEYLSELKEDIESLCDVTTAETHESMFWEWDKLRSDGSYCFSVYVVHLERVTSPLFRTKTEEALRWTERLYKLERLAGRIGRHEAYFLVVSDDLDTLSAAKEKGMTETLSSRDLKGYLQYLFTNLLPYRLVPTPEPQRESAEQIKKVVESEEGIEIKFDDILEGVDIDLGDLDKSPPRPYSRRPRRDTKRGIPEKE